MIIEKSIEEEVICFLIMVISFKGSEGRAPVT